MGAYCIWQFYKGWLCITYLAHETFHEQVGFISLQQTIYYGLCCWDSLLSLWKLKLHLQEVNFL